MLARKSGLSIQRWFKENERSFSFCYGIYISIDSVFFLLVLIFLFCRVWLLVLARNHSNTSRNLGHTSMNQLRILLMLWRSLSYHLNFKICILVQSQRFHSTYPPIRFRISNQQCWLGHQAWEGHLLKTLWRPWLPLTRYSICPLAFYVDSKEKLCWP